MKRIITYSFALLTLACSSDNSPASIELENLLGTWKVKKYFHGGNEIQLNSCELQSVEYYDQTDITYEERYIQNGECNTQISEIEYEISGDTIIATNPTGGFNGGEFIVKYQINMLTSNQLKLTRIYANNGFPWGPNGTIPQDSRIKKEFQKI